MSIAISKNTIQEHLYMQVYDHYREQIMDGRLPAGTRMPSLRKCSQELELSRTTIESAYLQLAADGYILAKPQSGYYVTNIASREPINKDTQKNNQTKIKYDFASSGVDRESFRFDLWQRYLKSALRQSDRLLSYGDPQGEADFRKVLADYVRQRRNVSCSPEDIVIGAGVQSLLHILCPLMKKYKTVSFPTPSFTQGSRIFEDYGFEIRYRNKDSDVIYVSPAHMTKWGEIMPVSRRMELIRYAAEHGSMIIEDDFENEFVYLQKPTPSLFGLAGGHGVIYIGSFSRLLLPSIRMSFMVLPRELSSLYHAAANNYAQTSSKAEQIALCQFIRDGHLAAQTRRLKRLYAQKMKSLQTAVVKTFGKSSQIKIGSAGMELAMTVSYPGSAKELKEKAQAKGLRLEILKEEPGSLTLLLSCTSIAEEDFLPACELLKQVLMQG